MTRRQRALTFLAVGLLLGLLLATRGLWRARQIVRVMFDGRDESVRLLRIDTVERGQPGYEEAGAALAEMIGDSTVRLEFEIPGKVERDRFKRLLAYVILPDGRNANVEMVRQGWSKFWKRYGRGRLADQEAEAREAKRGLWAKPLLIDPAEPPVPTPSIDEL